MKKYLLFLRTPPKARTETRKFDLFTSSEVIVHEGEQDVRFHEQYLLPFCVFGVKKAPAYVWYDKGGLPITIHVDLDDLGININMLPDASEKWNMYAKGGKISPT